MRERERKNEDEKGWIREREEKREREEEGETDTGKLGRKVGKRGSDRSRGRRVEARYGMRSIRGR